MPDWFTPAIFVAIAIAVGTALWKGGRWTGKIDTELVSIKSLLAEVRDKLDKIFERLGPQTSSGASPAQLTEFGERVAKGVDAHAWAALTAESVLSDQKLLDLEPYQIEAFCDEYIANESREDGEIKDKVQKAVYEFGIDRDRVLPVLRIPLREALLSRRARLQQ